MKELGSRYGPWSALGGMVLVLYLAGFGCSGTPRPKNTVMDLFMALHNDDTAVVSNSIDFDRAWRSVENDLRQPDDSLRQSIDWGGRLLASLTGEGTLRTRWMKSQVVINKTEVFGDSATVEVSFIDRETRVQYYNKMGLVRKPDRWVIVAFRIN